MNRHPIPLAVAAATPWRRVGGAAHALTARRALAEVEAWA